MQRVVGLLVFQTPEPRPIMEISPWIDRRFPEPIEALVARIEAEDHRRFVKSHLPFDGLPIYDEVKYIHVARDGRDAWMSFHNHVSGRTPQMLEALDRAGLEDDTIRRPYPRFGADPARYFQRWLGAKASCRATRTVRRLCHSSTLSEAGGTSSTARTSCSLHYNDPEGGPGGRNAAGRRTSWIFRSSTGGVARAGRSRRVRSHAPGRRGADGEAGLLLFQGGAGRFFHKGTNERWRGIFREDDLLLYDAKVRAKLSPACARWVAHGRLATG